VDEPLALRFQNRHNLLALVDFELRDQLPIGYRVPAGQEQLFGIAPRIGDRLENSEELAIP